MSSLEISLLNPVFATYAFWATVVGVKMLLIAPLTAVTRMLNKVCASPEDAVQMGWKQKPSVQQQAAVERVRRIHQNDLENIPAFWVLGFLYVFTYPSLFFAKICFAGFGVSRIAHTLAYLSGVVPVRGLSFMIGLVIMFFMAANVLMATVL